MHDYNERFTKVLSNIKRRHDPVVTTIAQGILEFKKESKEGRIDRSIQTFLDRFYMSRIGASRRRIRAEWALIRPLLCQVSVS